VTARPDHGELAQDVNHHIREVLWGFDSSHGEFLCECERMGCTERIAMTVSDYDALRGGQNGAKLLAPQHDGAVS
jgi:hypothetical protein